MEGEKKEATNTVKSHAMMNFFPPGDIESNSFMEPGGARVPTQSFPTGWFPNQQLSLSIVIKQEIFTLSFQGILRSAIAQSKLEISLKPSKRIIVAQNS